MTKKKDEEDPLKDCAQEGTGNENVMSQLERWAVEDAQMTFHYPNPQEFFKQSVEQRVPDKWYPEKWKKACINYLVDSYSFWRRYGDQIQPDMTMTKGECEWMAYKETYEWMYTQINTKRLKTRSKEYRNW